MKAIVYTEYGPPDVLHLQEVTTPTPMDNEILIRVYATRVNFGDLLARKFGHVTPREFNMPSIFWLPARFEFGLRKPRKRILGNEFAGVVTATGKDVRRLKPGDEVFGYRGQSMGANAEFMCMPENGMVTTKPANLSFAEAASIPYGAIIAMSILRRWEITSGQKVLVIGASGAIGTALVQITKHFGAEVTGVCGTSGVEFVRSLGADHVIDYTRQDFTKNGQTYDFIFDIMNKSSFRSCKRSLKPKGRYVLVSFKMKQVFQMLWTALRGGKKVICAVGGERLEDLIFAKELVEAGEYKTAVDRCYPLERTAEAHRYAEQGHKRGPVVVTLAPSP